MKYLKTFGESELIKLVLKLENEIFTTQRNHAQNRRASLSKTRVN